MGIIGEDEIGAIVEDNHDGRPEEVIGLGREDLHDGFGGTLAGRTVRRWNEAGIAAAGRTEAVKELDDALEVLTGPWRGGVLRKGRMGIARSGGVLSGSSVTVPIGRSGRGARAGANDPDGSGVCSEELL